LAGRQLSAIRRRLLVLAGSRLAAAGIASLAMLVAARAAGPTGIGIWSMAVAVQGYALHLGELGLRSVATAEAVRTRGGARALVRRYLALRLAVSLVVIAATLAVVTVFQPEHLGLMALTLLSLIPVALQLDWVPLVDGRSMAASLPLLARPSSFLLLLLAWPAPLTPHALALAFLLSWLVAAAVSVPPLYRPTLVEGEGAPPAAGYMLRHGIGFTAVTLLAQLQLSADLLTVGWSLGVEAAGVYYLATAIAVAATVLANAAGQLALARLGACRGRPEAIRSEARRLCLAGGGTGLLVATLLVLAAPPLLPRLFGPGFAAATTILVWLAPWVVLVHLTTPLQAALGAAGRQRGAFLANIVMVAVLLPLLGLAAWLGQAWAFAMARSLAELIRLFLLAHAAGLGVTVEACNAGDKSRDVRFSGAR
jgi:O-antigen/teichoic acid export membrane protein